MTTVINNPGNGEGSAGALNMLIGVIVLIVVIALFFVYVLPYMRGEEVPEGGAVNVNLQLPASSPSPAN